MPFARHLTLFPVVLLATIVSPGPTPTTGYNINDFIAYWSAGRLALGGSDPYAAEPVLALERQVGFSQANPLIMRNPPWTVPVVAPLAVFPFVMAQKLWFVLGLIAILVSARWLWGIYHIEGQSLWTALLLTALFLPVAVVLAIGQIGPLVLLGIAGFLHFEKQKKLIVSGLFLFLVALKPHLIFLLWIALLVWSIRRRTLTILAALASVTLAACLIALVLDHFIFFQYIRLLASGGVLTELTPTVSGFLRLSLGRYYPLQIAPAFVALVWFFFHWNNSRDRWQWSEEVPVLLLVSLLTTSYGWFFDQVVLLPCVFQATAWIASTHKTTRIFVAAFYLGTNALVLGLILSHYTTFYYGWTVPAWCLLYAFARVRYRSPSATENGT
ncbi:MAG TPA: glycosyltransferase family 87 protein [Candidatus Sulfotelmatobacter sp.]|nr:glycosyltransferase family 87 protein [Candidatus Sulfotelmatobacter sp.]